MSDREKLIALLVEWGVPFELDDDEDGGGTDLTVGGIRNERVTGYANFVTIFEFNADGSFHAIGAWE